MSDEPRLLHSRSELGYTSQPMEALEDEPEAVPVEYQRRLSDDALAASRDRQLDAVRELLDVLSPALDAIAALRLDRDLRSTLRAMQRQRDQLKRAADAA